MATKPLQSITFPGLPDTYTVPQVDATLTTSGAAADAKVVGDDIGELNERIEAIEEGGAGEGVPHSVRQAIYVLLNSAVFTEDDLTDEISVIEEWSASHATAIHLSADTLSFSSIASQTLTATVTPSDSTDEVTWSSSNTTVATVNDGVVTSAGNGTCTITATAGTVSATCSVTVSGILDTFSVTNNLSNCTNSNNATVVEENASYSATITADSGYTLSSVTVTMGGVDVTSTVYSNGNISILSATGNIVITASCIADSRTLVHSYDFTQSINDTVGSLTPTLGNSQSGSNPTQSSVGLSFDAANQYCSFGEMGVAGKEFEIDIASMNVQTTNQHTRVFMCTPNASQGTGALIFRQGSGYNYWAGYVSSGWSNAYSNTLTRNGLSGKTVKLVFDSSGYCDFYLDGDLIARSSITFGTRTDLKVSLGGIASATSYSNDMVITGFRIYEVAA